MTSDQPRDARPIVPPTAPAPPTQSASASGPGAPAESALKSYHRVADTVGGVPNLRWKDNVFQIIVTAVMTFAGALSGCIFPWDGAWFAPSGLAILLCTAGGLVAGVFLSGIVLMVMGWVRTYKGR